MLILSGVYSEYQEEVKINTIFQLHWSIVSEWNENSRYLTGINSERVKKFITSVKEFMKWIQMHL